MIEKCAAIIVREHRLLVVRKRATAIFISPGGKLEAGEDCIDCLRRELLEELNVKLLEASAFGTYDRPSALESGSIRIHVWMVTISGECRAAAEIEELRWITGEEWRAGLSIGSVFGECVIPELVRLGHIHA
jgi:8-oxo-dGTP diphosphatase